VSSWKAPGRRAAGLAAVVSLLGSGIAALVLVEGSGGLSGGSGGTSGGPGTTLASPLDIAGQAQPSPARQSAASRAGVQLLQQAVIASQDTPYCGVQVVLWQGQGGQTTAVVDVWHQPGRVTLVSAAGAGGPSAVTPSIAGSPAAMQSGSGLAAGPSADAGYPDPDGVLGVSPQLLTLLTANYQVAYTGQGAAAGRTAFVVEVRRPGGALAARIWLDAATKLPLQRQIFAGSTRMVSEDAFTDLQLGSEYLDSMPSSASAPWTTQLDSGSLTALRGQGWPLPATLPGNMALFDATRTSAGPGQVIGLSYSDGLLVVSLFLQRGELAGPMTGWRQVTLGGRTVYAADPGSQGDRSLAWSADGYVYTLVADAPDTTVGQVVTALPAGNPPGFWHRMAHGLHRMASWANPLRH
jgi:sigma-E factor negative regulatory protein RseB